MRRPFLIYSVSKKAKRCFANWFPWRDAFSEKDIDSRSK